MAGIPPRDAAGWMRTIERDIVQLKTGMRSTADYAAAQKAEELADQINTERERIPAAPVELTIQSSISLGRDKLYYASALVDFPDVTKSTDAVDIEIASYELWGRRTSTPTAPLKLYASSTDSSLQANLLTPGEEWDFYVRAMGVYTLAPGVFSAKISTVLTSDVTPPPQPTAPNATASRGVIMVTWDGLSVSGSMPGDLAYVIVAGGPATDPTAEIARFNPGGAQTHVVTGVPYNTEQFYRLRAVDTSGNLSPWSAQDSAVTVPLVDADIILEHIDAAETQITNIGSESILSGAILSSKLADNAVTQAKLADQAVAASKLATSVNNDIAKGIADAATAQAGANAAQSTANTANAAAGTAQTAADLAKAQVQALIASKSVMNYNGDFERPITSPPEGWPTRSLTYVEASAGVARSGTNILRMAPTTAAQAYAYTDYMAASTNRIYYVEYWVRLREALVAGNSALQMRAFFSWLKTDGTSGATGVSDSSAYGYAPVTMGQLSTTTWTKVVQVYKATTADIKQMRFGPASQALAVTGNSFEVDDVKVLDITDAQNAMDAAKAAQAKADTAFADAQTALTNAGLAQTTANGKAKVYYTATAPAGSGYAVNDIWFRSTDNRIHIWDGTTWVARADAAVATAQAAADAAAAAGAAADAKAVAAQAAADLVAASALQLKTALTGGNLFLGGDFETTTPDNTAFRQSTDKRSGTYAAKVPATAPNTIPWNKIPVDPSSTFEVRFWAKAIGTFGTVAPTVTADNYGADGASLGTTTTGTVVSAPSLNTTAYQEYVFRLAPGSTVRFIVPKITLSGSSYGTGSVVVDDAAMTDVTADVAAATAASAAATASAAAATADGKAVTAQTAANNAQSSANAAQTSANNAATAAATADTKAVNAQTAATNAQSAADAAQSSANSAASAASTADGKAVAAQSSANSAASAASAAQASANDAATLANSVIKTSTSDATGTPPSVGAIWNKTSADGTLIIKTWTSNAAGTAWVERKLDDAVLGNINAVKIIAGTIDAARFNAADIRAKFIEAGKITAADIVAGTLTSASGVFGTIDASIINAGTINAARYNAADIRTKFLAAGLITAADIVTGSLTSASGIFGTLDASILNAGTINAARFNAADIRAKFIEAGKITAADIVTGTLTSASGIFGTIDASILNAGTLNAARIAAGSIAANKLVIGSAVNALPDPSFSLPELLTARLTRSSGGTGGWTVSAPASTGVRSVARTTTTTNDQFQFAPYTPASGLAANAIQCVAGQKWQFDLEVETDITAGVRWNIYRYWADGTVTYAGLSAFDAISGKRKVGGANGYTWTVPAGCVAFELALGCNTSGALWTVYGNALIAMQAGATLIQDGVITTNHVAANSITATHIKTNEILASNIKTGTLTSASGVFGDISAASITSGTIDANRLVAADIRAKFLTAGLVTAADMVTGTITATSGIIGSLDISKVTTGSMSGSFITAKTLVADQLLIARGGNLFIDEDMSDSANYTTPSMVDAQGTGRNGKGSVLLAMNSVQTGTYYASANSAAARARRTRIVPGSSYRIGAWVYVTADAPVNTVSLYVRLYRDSDNGNIFTSPSSVKNDGLNGRPGIVPANTWTFISGLVTAPSASPDYTGAAIGFYKEAGYTTGTTRWSDPIIQNAAGGELIVDGAITAAKVAANQISAKQMVIGDFTNLMQGSGFEDTTAVPWALNANGKHVTSTTRAKYGTRSLRLGLSAAVGTIESSTFIGDATVVEGEEWQFSFWVYLDSTFNGTTESKLRIANASGGAFLTAFSFNGVTKSSWQQVTGSYVIPAGVLKLDIQLWSDQAAGFAYIDDMQMRRKAEATLIRSLGVEQLTAGAANMDTAVIDKVWTNVVRSRRITTDMLAVGRGANCIVDEYLEDADVKAIRNTKAGGWGAWSRNVTLNLNWYGGTLTAGTSRSFYFETTSGSYDTKAFISVREGQKWRFSFMYSATTAGPHAAALVVFKDGTTSYTTSGWTATDGTANVDGPALNQQTMDRIYTVPANVAYIMPAVQFNSAATAAYVYGGASMTNMMDASLVVDGGIVARHITASEEMWAKVLGAHTIKAFELDANQIFADTGWIGKLDARTAVFLTNNDGTGYTSTVTGQGLKVTYTDPADGEVSTRIALGTFGDDYLNLANDTGVTVASMDKDGNVTGQNVFAEQTLVYKGEEMTDVLNKYSQGCAVTALGYNLSGDPVLVGTSWLRVMGLRFVAKAGRNYKVTFQGMKVYSGTAGDTINTKMTYLAGQDPTSATVPTDSALTSMPTANRAVTTPPLVAMGTFNATSSDVEITVVVWARRETGSGPVNYDTYPNDANHQKALRLWVEDMGLDVPETGTMYLEEAAAGTPAAPTKVVRTVEYGSTSVKSFKGDNTAYSWNTSKGYQGLSPAGYGNLKSLWTFPSLTGILSGATVLDIWVYFYFEHWYNASGGTARIVYHGNSAQPTNYSSLGLAVTSTSWPRGAGRWVRIPSSLYAGFISGTYKGFGLEGDSSYNTYGIANAARIRIRYSTTS